MAVTTATQRPDKQRRRTYGAGLIALTVALLMMSPGAMAQGGDDPDPDGDGWITIHDDEDGEATTTPTCDFWIRGHNAVSATGRLEAAHRLDGPSAHQHHLGNWTGTANDEGGFDFFEGPFTLHESDRDWLIVAVAQTDDGEASIDGEGVEYIACGDEDNEDPFAQFSCPIDLMATANGDGSISLDWTGTPDADRYVVLRKEAGQAFNQFKGVTTTDESAFVDETTEPGVTYDYFVTAHMDTADGTERTSCGQAEVTAIPFFGALGGALAVIAGVGAYALVGRRRP